MHILGKKEIHPGRKNGPVTTNAAAPPALNPATVKKVRNETPQESAVAPDNLDQFVENCNSEDPMLALMLMFWKIRNQDQPFTMDITAADIKGFEDCIAYLEVKPEIRVFRPQGMPASAGAPATAKRSAIAPHAAGKPKDYVVIQMVDQNGDAFVPIENNEADLQKSKEAQRVRRIKDTAPQLAAQLISDLQANTTSSSTIMDAAEALKLLAAR